MPSELNLLRKVQNENHFDKRPAQELLETVSAKVNKKQQMVESAQDTFRIQELNETAVNFNNTMRNDMLNIAKEWQRTKAVLTKFKELTDMSNFVVYQDFDTSYDEVLNYIKNLEDAINTSIENLNEFNLDVRAIVPEEL